MMKDSILIVEDEANIRANIAEFLQSEGYRSEERRVGKECTARRRARWSL